MNKPPKWFVVVAIVALLWNLLGCIAFISDMLLTADDIAKLPEAQRALYNARPIWAVVATAVAVFSGLLGCIGLLMHRKWAFTLFVVSLIGLLAQDFGLFVLADGVRLGGPVPLVLQTIVLLVAIGLILLSRKAIVREWIG